jgi:hypothetical protein
MSLDAAHECAKSLIDDVSPRLDSILTEEDAKTQLITRILVEVLGWRHADISNERKHENGYSDYIVGNNSRRAFLVEA